MEGKGRGEERKEKEEGKRVAGEFASLALGGIDAPGTSRRENGVFCVTVRGVDSSSRGETETNASGARDRDEAEAYQLRGETEPRHYCTSRWSRDRGIKTEATSHIHIIPRTDVVLKGSGRSLELRLNQSGIFKHNFMYVMLKCLPTKPRRLLLRPRLGPRPSVSRPRPRPRRLVSRPR